jgi:hypothetical protein
MRPIFRERHIAPSTRRTRWCLHGGELQTGFGFAQRAEQLTDLGSMRGLGCRPPQTLSVQSDI